MYLKNITAAITLKNSQLDVLLKMNKRPFAAPFEQCNLNF